MVSSPTGQLTALPSGLSARQKSKSLREKKVEFPPPSAPVARRAKKSTTKRANHLTAVPYHDSVEMVTKSKLKLALAADKGVDFQKKKMDRKIKSKHREAEKAKAKKAKLTGKEPKAELELEEEEEEEEEEEDDDVISLEGGITLNAEFEDADSDSDEEDDDEDQEDARFDIEALDDTDSESDSEVEMEENIERPAKKPKTNKQTPTEVEEKDEDEDEDEDDEDEEEEDPEEDDIPLSDIEGDAEDLEDVVPHTRLTINNKAALLASLNRIRLDTSSAVPFATHQSLISSKPTAESVPDVQDDLQRELAILSQALEGARKGRTLLLKEGVPFSRPSDYFAEMAKDDGQMQKIKDKLIEEASNKKAAAEARKLRDLKKFGKQVQVAKLQERQKAKKDTLEKIKTLKRKRQEGSGNLDTHEGDLFDVAVDNELKGHRNSKTGGPRGSGSGVNAKRQKKNEKYGFGGKKRHSKSGDAMSSGDLSGFNAKRMKGGVANGRVTKTRPGKNRRKAMNK